jgi:hypothetical protein
MYIFCVIRRGAFARCSFVRGECNNTTNCNYYALCPMMPLVYGTADSYYLSINIYKSHITPENIARSYYYLHYYSNDTTTLYATTSEVLVLLVATVVVIWMHSCNNTRLHPSLA